MVHTYRSTFVTTVALVCNLEILVAITFNMQCIFHKVYVANMVITTVAFVCNSCTQA